MPNRMQKVSAANRQEGVSKIESRPNTLSAEKTICTTEGTTPAVHEPDRGR